jgi:serine/threonine protein kinase
MTENPPTPPKKISRYEIRSEIGRGGMATVYLAYDPNFGREVAIKVLPRELMHDPNFRTRFNREARTIATLEHPAIVPVYDFGEDDGQPFLVMRYLGGGSLVSRIRSGPIPIDEVTHILSRIGSALDAAHAKGVVHRDLKPANILFDQYGEAYLGDFGIAQLSTGGGTLTGSQILGTPAYMSPEQINGAKIDGRADIYALGIVVFEMLTGQTPFQADSPIKMMMMHISTPPPAISEIDARFPHGSGAVLQQALAKDPDRRYQTASDFIRAFQDLTADRKPGAAGTATEGIDRSALTRDFTREEVGREAEKIPPPESSAGRGKPRRWTPVAVAGAIAVCLCLGGSAAALLAFSDVGKSLLGFVPPTAVPAATATATQNPTATPVPTQSLLLSTPSQSAAPYVAGEPYLLTNGESVSTQPQIGVDSEGLIHVFWMDKKEAKGGKIFRRMLAPDGTWTDPECVSCLVGEPKYMFDYEFATRGNQRVCVGFEWMPEYDYVVSTACYRGTGPADIGKVEMSGNGYEFLMDMDPAGNLVAVFPDTNSILAGNQTITDGSRDMDYPAFAVDTQGGRHLAWFRHSTPPVLAYAYSPAGKTAWTAPQVIASPSMEYPSKLILYPETGGGMQLLAVADPVLTLRWKEKWSPAKVLREDFIGYDFTFVADKNGKIFLLGTGYYSGEKGIWAFEYDKGAAEWNGPSLIRTLDNLQFNGFAAAIGPSGKLLLAYTQSDEDVTVGDIYFVEAPSL